jgi:hypothetical protein
MMALWIVQGIVNFLFLAFVLYMLYARRQNPAAREKQFEEKFLAVAKVLETRVHAVETEAQQYRRAADAQLKRLASICDQANEILHRGFFSDVNTGPTEEETELKAALSSPDPLHIPTIEQLERTKARLKTEIQIDLKTLLQDQLT